MDTGVFSKDEKYYLYGKRQKLFKELDIKEKYKYNKKCEYKEYSNACILPDNNHLGGVVDENGQFIKESVYIGDWVKRGGYYEYNKENIISINKTVIFLGFFYKHWGHFLLDSIGRLWISNELDVHEYYWVYLESDNQSIDGNYREFLEYLGFDMNKRIIIHDVSRFDSVIIPEVCRNNCYQHTDDYEKTFSRIILNSNFEEVEVPDKVYLSRQKFPEAISKERGEKNIQENYKKNGYTVFYPEELSLKKQIAIFQKTKEIVCINGTISLNFVFSSPDIKLIILNKTSLVHRNMHEISTIGKGKITYVDAYVEPIINHPKYLGKGPFLLRFSKKMRELFHDNDMSYTIEKNIKDYFWYFKEYLRYKKRSIQSFICKLFH